MGINLQVLATKLAYQRTIGIAYLLSNSWVIVLGSCCQGIAMMLGAISMGAVTRQTINKGNLQSYSFLKIIKCLASCLDGFVVYLTSTAISLRLNLTT